MSSALIVNADDWGRDARTTQRIFDCVRCGAVTSVSAMVFMEGSVEGAASAVEHGVDAGLHLNFTTPLSSPDTPLQLAERQRMLGRYLRRHRLAQVVFHPGLARAFEYVFAAQVDEFRRLYGMDPQRIDGHHHMHLCANVVLGRLLPAGVVVRRNFSFQPGEKGAWNRMYRKLVDAMLTRRHRLTDLLFSLPPFETPGRVERIVSLAGTSVVELETHPVDEPEYRFLTEGQIARRAQGVAISPFSAVFHLRTLEGHV
jgi:predicted glycoside hydrolase/deacetylase ChbG (UPF0249 family)